MQFSERIDSSVEPQASTIFYENYKNRNWFEWGTEKRKILARAHGLTKLWSKFLAVGFSHSISRSFLYIHTPKENLKYAFRATLEMKNAEIKVKFSLIKRTEFFAHIILLSYPFIEHILNILIVLIKMILQSHEYKDRFWKDLSLLKLVKWIACTLNMRTFISRQSPTPFQWRWVTSSQKHKNTKYAHNICASSFHLGNRKRKKIRKCRNEVTAPITQTSILKRPKLNMRACMEKHLEEKEKVIIIRLKGFSVL